MANETETREDKTRNQTVGGTTESRTTLNSESVLHSGMLDNRDPQLDKAHDYHLDQDMGESMEQVNANLHLGSKDEEETFGEEDAPGNNTDDVAGDDKPANLADSNTEGSETSEGPEDIASVAATTPVVETSAVGASASGGTSSFTNGLLNGASQQKFSQEGVTSGGAGDDSVREPAPASAEDDNVSDAPVQTDEIASNLSEVADSDLATNAVDENAATGSTTGIQASADVAAGASVTYSLLDDADGLFSIDPETGIVTVAGALDAEAAGTHDIVVLATASDGQTETETFSIAIRDVNEYDVSPIDTVGTVTNEISENVSGGSEIGIEVTASDQDVSDAVSYSIDDPRFIIDEQGVVSITETAAFDAETEASVTFTVTATSTDGSTSEQSFTLAIADENEFAISGVTDADGAANTIAEDATAGTQVGITALASDADATDTVSYTVDDARFAVDENGVVTVADGASFDAETEGSIDVMVTATSTDGSTSTETFTIAVSDVDESDVSAVTDTDAADNTIAEDAAAGTTVGVTASATDVDVTDSVSYTVDDTRFTVDENGVVTVADGASLDAETEGSIDVTVTATSTDGSTSTETFTIAVSDVDESDVSAVTDADASDNTIAEDAAAGTQVGVTASATDADVTDSVSYTVDDARFDVDENGVVTVADGASFNAETEGSIDVAVTATSTDGSTSTETFTIAVSDVDESDVSSVTDTDAADNTIAEDAAAGTTVGVTASATDADVTDSVSYSVDDTRFTVDENGVVTVADGASFDAETEGSIDVTVTATSTDGSTSTETFTIAVSDVDESDVSAVTDADASDNTIAEDAAAGATVGVTASATDADVTDSVSYSVDDARFSVDENGVVTVADGASFDAETEGSIDVTVTATSTDGSTSTEIFTIAVTDVDESDVSAVTDTNASDNTIAEDAAAGTTVGVTASATDADVTDSVSYSVDDARFSVDENGVVTVADGASFDAETEGSINVTVTATSTDGSTSTETFTIAVSDVDESNVSAVSDTDASDNTIAEDATAGTTVGVTASATDTDITDSVSYTVDDSRFTVDENGVVTVADGASFDAETEGSIDVTVTATSTDGSTSTETFTIAVSDVDESDVSAVTDTDASDNTIAEDAAVGTTVGVTASATDADVTDSVSYTVDDARFAVDENGVVTVADGASFDAETESSIDVTVTATSTDGSTSTETFTIAVSDVDESDVSAVTDTDVSDNTIAEDATAGSQVGVTASATDADVTDSVSYTVDDSRFTVDENGVVTVADGASFNAETEGSIDVAVTATSTDGSTSTETFTIAVSDVDESDVSAVTDTDASDNTIAEDATAGTTVGVTASATDADVTDSVSYTVDDSRFTVDKNGVVTVADGASFDAETEGSIDVTVTATSTDGSTSTETFTIAVSDVDESDVSAVTDTDATDNTIAEDATAGTTVGVTASATDADVTDSVSYSVDDSRFAVDENGVVTVADGASFDAETEGSINVTVTATSTDGSTSTETFTIAVSDVDESDVSAVTDTDATDNTIAEDATAGTTVGVTASATDADVTDSVSYTVDDARFDVDENGVVTVADGASFDAETEGSIDVTVTATSTDGSTSTETFTIAVSDIDESDVSAVSDTDASDNTISEDATAGTTVGVTASATDTDVTDTVSYSVDDARFTVDENGVVTVADGASFDAETEGSIDVTVTATSTDGSTSSETFTIAVSDVDESDVSAVTDTDASDNTIAEDAAAGTTVGVTASATDADVTDSVTVTATSPDGSTSSETFTIAVSDVDESDVSAVTDTDASDNTIAEDAAAGTTVGVTASATDADVTDSVSYSVDDARFSVDENGVVTVADGASFDAESEGSIDVTVTATSTDGSTSTETFTIAVSDVDESDVSAVTDTNASDNTIAEDAAAGTQVGVTASATDADVTDSVSYSVDDARFSVDENGVVTVADGASFDAETESFIDVTVTATSTDGSTSTETFTIAVSDVDESDVSAVTDTDASDNTIAEDAAAGTTVGVTASATDADVTDSVSYTVDDARFTVDENGVVTVADGASFDAETEGSIDVTVTATSTDGSTSSETFTIAVSDVDESDVSAVTDTDASDNSIAEDAAAGTQVGVTASATDADVTDSVSYSVDDARFTVDENGVVTVADGASFDAETEGSIDVTVTATSTDGSTSTETFTIAVSDVDESDVSAVTDTDATDNTIAEDAAAGTQVGVTASATDADVTDSVSYTVDDARFTLDENGVVTVADGASFDAETEGSIDVTVTATSTDGSTSTETFTIAVSDIDESDVSAVTDTDASDNTIAEDATAGTTVGVTASATDADVTDSVSYTVDDARFAVDGNGVVTVADGATFDAETEGSIDVTVTATSTDGSTSTETFTIAVSDVDESDVSAVTDTNSAADTLSENAAEGDAIGITVAASDGDVTDSVTYTISDSRFTIDENGEVTVAADAEFNYESEPTIYLTVTATSTDGSSSQETFEVSVADVAEAYQLEDGQTTFTDTGVAETTITGNDSADTITAHDDGSEIYSGAGDDTVYGGKGEDRILYGEGADIVYGGGGNDFIDDEVGTQPNTDANYLDGGEGNDTIYGGGGDDTLIGGEGNDMLAGENDDDTLEGGAGADNLYGGSGSDTLEGGAGNDYLDGGSDTDTAVYSGNFADYSITLNDNGSYTVTDLRNGSPEGTDTVWNVENFRFADGDVLAGDLIAEDIGAVSDTDSSANSVDENAASGSSVGVTAFAEDGNTSDTVTYAVDDARFAVDGNGVVTVATGASFDYETETDVSITVTATSSDGSTSQETFTINVADVAEDLQLADGGVTFTDAGVSETSITGGSGNDVITAHDDGGTIDGGAGDDTLRGGAGDDTIHTGSGADDVDGGEGSDTIVLNDSDGGRTNTIVDTGSTGTDTLVLGTGSGTYRIQGDFSAAAGIEVIDGSSATGDQLGTKDAQANFDFSNVTLVGVDEIIGTGNNDTIVGSASDDTISLGEGDDTVTGGQGDDILDGEGGTDTAIYSGNFSDYDITENDDGSYTIADTRVGGTDGTDTVSNVENFRFADGDVAAGDLVGSPVGSVSDSDSSTNTIHETDGSGTQVGITATASDPDGDAVSYALSDDRFQIDADGVVTVADHAFFDSQEESSIDLVVTATSADGSESSETFSISVTGDYDYEFTGGTDSGSFSGSGQSYSIDGVGGNDVISTGDYDDRIEGGTIDGNDNISGGGGRDLLFGQAGTDVIDGGSGDDVIVGGTGNDNLTGGDGSDLFMHGLGDGSDVINGGAGVAWTDVIDLGGGPGVTSAGEYGTDWTVTVTNGTIETTDTDAKVLELSQDADGYIDFADGSRVTFNDVEEIRCFFRGCHPSAYGDEFQESLNRLKGDLDAEKCLFIWHVGTGSVWTEAPVWFHGDVAAGNLIVADSTVKAYIDFGLCGVGDPACDFVLAWTYFDVEARQIFRAASAVDDETWHRARAWALWKALVCLSGLSSPDMDGRQVRALRAILEEDC
eukprot:g1573.t1